MIPARGGRRANRLFVRDLADGRLCEDYRTILSLDEQYLDLNAGLTDLVVVSMAARYRTTRILDAGLSLSRAPTAPGRRLHPPASGRTKTTMGADRTRAGIGEIQRAVVHCAQW